MNKQTPTVDKIALLLWSVVLVLMLVIAVWVVG